MDGQLLGRSDGRGDGQDLFHPFDLLLGRKTYEIFAAHWPNAGSEPIAVKFNAVTKFVATSSNEPLTWQNSVPIHDVVGEVGRLKAQDGPNLLLQGSGELIQTLLASELIDEFNFLTFPVVLGRGKRLFGPGTLPAGLQLVDTKTSTTGVVMTSYVPSGPISTGSFELKGFPPPNRRAGREWRGRTAEPVQVCRPAGRHIPIRSIRAPRS